MLEEGKKAVLKHVCSVLGTHMYSCYDSQSSFGLRACGSSSNYSSSNCSCLEAHNLPEPLHSRRVFTGKVEQLPQHLPV